jgi:uncharacterized SAM-binding protein YcdF (DUF218 family)
MRESSHLVAPETLRGHRGRPLQKRLAVWFSLHKRELGWSLLVALLMGVAYRQLAGGSTTARRYDAVVVPGGGLDADGKPAPWVAARLDAALKHDADTAFYLVLSRGTTHKPPPLDAEGYPVDEAAASAVYLQERGIAAERVLLESWSLDTIGNAAFTRLMHADLKNWKQMLVVTSAFHAPRVREIFGWVFNLPPHVARRPFITYEEVDDAGMRDEARDGRVEKERRALEELRGETMVRVSSLEQLHAFLFQRHAAYRARPAGSRAGDARAGHLGY